MRAYRASSGEVTLSREPPDSRVLRLPCGKCIGCRSSKAVGWSLRCQLELQRHDSAVFTTLTYDDAHKPTTLNKQHYAAFIKRLRKHYPAGAIRHFGCGEYGEKSGRPHYHAILYGLSVRDRDSIEDAWNSGNETGPLGFTRTEEITPARIAYTAGYVAKKIGKAFQGSYEYVDPETGEVIILYGKHVYNNGNTWQDQFQQMSRRPGIGAHARQWIQSWRLYAVTDGTRIPVPRYLHEAWKAQATIQEKEELEIEKIKMSILRDTSEYQMIAAEKLAEKKQEIRAAKRNYH